MIWHNTMYIEIKKNKEIKWDVIYKKVKKPNSEWLNAIKILNLNQRYEKDSP